MGVGFIGGLTVFAWLLVSQADGPPKNAELNAVRLYVPIPQLEERFRDVEALANYIKSLERRADEIVSGGNPPEAKGLLIAVGIKSGRRSRVWCQAVDGAISPELIRRLERELAQVEAVDLKKGPAGFAMEMKLLGQSPAKYPEFPDSWLEPARQTKSQTLIPPDELFKVLWPD